jgi:hypothetical protein
MRCIGPGLGPEDAGEAFRFESDALRFVIGSFAFAEDDGKGYP